jgi:hypothetical protein
MSIPKKRASRDRSRDGTTAPLPDSSAQQVPFSVKKRESVDQKVVRLCAERDQLCQDNVSLIKERAAAVAHTEAAKRELARAAASADGESVKQLNQMLEKTLAETEAALEATSARTVRVKERASKRLDAAPMREREATAAAVKAQEQRDVVLTELEGTKLLIGTLKAKVGTLERDAARMAATLAAEAASALPPRSPPAKGRLSKMRPQESEEEPEAPKRSVERRWSGSGGDDEDEDDESGSGSSAAGARHPTTADEHVKTDPALARQLELLDKAGANKHRIAHGRLPDEGSTSHLNDTAAHPVAALAKGGARSAQLGDAQKERLDRRVAQQSSAMGARSAHSPSPGPAAARARSASAQSNSTARGVSDDELTFGSGTRTPASQSRVGPHAAFSRLAQRAASAAIGTVRQLAGGGSAADSPGSFVGVAVYELGRSRGRRSRAGRRRRCRLDPTTTSSACRSSGRRRRGV